MRMGSVVVGAIAILVGAVWILQGAGALPGSFMTGQRLWLFIGIVVAIIGLALGYNGIRRPTRS
jgi:hypothetical protein